MIPRQRDDAPDDDFSTVLEQVRQLGSPMLARFVASTALELTILARDDYSPSSIGAVDTNRLHAFNECQHFLIGILTRLLFEEEMDVDSLIDGIERSSRDRQIGDDVRRAVTRSIRS